MMSRTDGIVWGRIVRIGIVMCKTMIGMIVLDELFTLHGFELCSEILFEVELPRAG